MHPVPTVTSPTPGGTIAATGFTVQLASPDDTMYTVLELYSETVISASLTEVREWTVVLPPDTTSFSFVELPTGVPTPLIAGRTWTFSATSVRVDSGPLLAPGLSGVTAYLNLCATWVGLKEADREVAAFASNAFTVTSN